MWCAIWTLRGEYDIWLLHRSFTKLLKKSEDMSNALLWAQYKFLSKRLHWNLYIVVQTEICLFHYNDVIMSTMASQITSLTIVYSIVCSGTDQIIHQSSASLAFVRGIHRWQVNSPHKWPVTRKIFPFDDVIMLAPIYGLVVNTFRPTDSIPVLK